MTKKINPEDYKLGPDVKVTEVDLDVEPITLPDGTVLDNAAAERYGREVADKAAARRRGRPSLGVPGAHSPRLAARVPEDLKARVERIAERKSVRSSEIVREALEEYVEHHEVLDVEVASVSEERVVVDLVEIEDGPGPVHRRQ